MTHKMHGEDCKIITNLHWSKVNSNTIGNSNQPLYTREGEITKIYLRYKGFYAHCYKHGVS